MARAGDRTTWMALAGCIAAAALAVPGAASASETATSRSAVPPSQAVVSILSPHEVHAGPSSRSRAQGLLYAKTAITEERTVVPVLARDGAFVEVMLPGRPNGHVGWIDQANTVTLDTPWHIVIDLSQRLVTVYRAGIG